MLTDVSQRFGNDKKSPMKSVLFWFRRDLRVADNAGLYHALESGGRVYCTFIFDRDILDKLPSKADRRVEFIWESLQEVHQQLVANGGGLIVRHASAKSEIPKLAAELGVNAVYTNEDYEPAAIARDRGVAVELNKHSIGFEAFKDTVVFEKSEVLTLAGKPFSVFTPYKNAWLKKLSAADLKPLPSEQLLDRLAPVDSPAAMPSLASMGFETTNIKSILTCGMSGAAQLRDDFINRIADYKDARDFPAVKGVSYLSTHNRFGTISIRELATVAHAETVRRKNIGAETWLAELIWNRLYAQSAANDRGKLLDQGFVDRLALGRKILR